MSAPIYRGGPPFQDTYRRYKNSVVGPIVGLGAPTNAVTGAGVAGPGSFYVDYTDAVGAWYFNSNTKASPTWTAFGSTAGAATPTSVAATGAITSSSPTAGVGYATGAGGAVIQGTGRTTAVVLDKMTGSITLFSAAGSATPFSFTVTCAHVAATDVILVNQKSGTDKYEIFVTAVGAGSFQITAFTTGGTTTETPVFNFAVIKGVAA